MILNTMQFIMPRFEEVGVYFFANVDLSVGWSVGRSVENYVRSITKELIAQGSSNLLWWLAMTIR